MVRQNDFKIPFSIKFKSYMLIKITQNQYNQYLWQEKNHYKMKLSYPKCSYENYYLKESGLKLTTLCLCKMLCELCPCFDKSCLLGLSYCTHWVLDLQHIKPQPNFLIIDPLKIHLAGTMSNFNLTVSCNIFYVTCQKNL